MVSNTDTGQSNSQLPQMIFRARRGKLIVSAGLMLLVALMNIPSIKEFIGLFHGEKLHSIWSIPLAILSPYLFFVGLALLAGLARGLPQVVMDGKAVTFRTMLSTKRAAWNSISPFTVTKRGRATFTEAFVCGDDVSKNVRSAKKLAIPNSFIEDIGNITQELNQYRSTALKDMPEAILNPVIPAAKTPIGDPNIRQPWATYTILLVLIAVYIFERSFAPLVDGAPSQSTLIALGAVGRNLVIPTHEWYRIFLAPLLHANLAHLLGNGIALYFAGYALEKLIGRAWFLAFFAIGAVSGSLFSMIFNNPDASSVGASGAVMALLSVLFVVSFRLADGSQKIRLQSSIIRILLPALFPLATNSGMHIDVSAHFGGLVSGTIASLALLKCWPAGSSILPPYRKAAKSVAVAGLCAVLLGTFLIGASDKRLCAAFDQDADKAIKACSKIIQDSDGGFKGVANALLYRGQAYLKDHQFDLALDDMNRAVSLQPDNVQFLTARGLAYTLVENSDAAIADFNRVQQMVKAPPLVAGIIGLRGTAYFHKGDNANADKDAAEALHLDPKNMVSLILQGDVNTAEGKYDEGIPAYTRALQLAPNDAGLLWGRGVAEFYNRMLPSAEIDLKDAVKADPSDGYKLLWLHIARTRAKENDTQEFKSNTAKIISGKWPRPVLDFYLNPVSPADVFTQARTGDARKQNEQLCEANFYVGEYYLLQGDKEKGRQYLQQANDHCPNAFVEHSGAHAELALNVH